MTSDMLDLRELADELDELRRARGDHDALLHDQEGDGWALGCPECDDEARDRLAALESLEAEFPHSLREQGDMFEPTLIAEGYFEEYARELAEDIGALPDGYTWPASHIDWKAAAEALQMDFTTVEFEGTTYYLRA